MSPKHKQISIERLCVHEHTVRHTCVFQPSVDYDVQVSERHAQHIQLTNECVADCEWVQSCCWLQISLVGSACSDRGSWSEWALSPTSSSTGGRLAGLSGRR